MAQSPEQGALPILFAATSQRARKAGYYGPRGFLELKGDVGRAVVGRRARDLPMAAWLWTESEKLARVDWMSAPDVSARPPEQLPRERSGSYAVGA